MLSASNTDVQSSSIPLDYRYPEQSFTNSWVSQEHIPNILNCTKGSGAGTPLADLVYGMAMSRVLVSLRKCIVDQNINSTMNVGSTIHHMVDVSFVDDVAIPVSAPANMLVQKTSMVVRCVCDVFHVYGMTLNFKPGKSEGIIGFFGPGARIARAQRSANKMQTLIVDTIFLHFRFVSSYQHVGTCIAMNMNMCEEITKRCGMMRSESRNLSSKIFKADGITLQHKLMVMQAYILSKGIFQCGTWPELPDFQYKRFHKCILDTYRSVCGGRPHARVNGEAIDVATIFSDDDIIFKYGFINPRTLLRMSKLGLLSRIVAKQPPLSLELIVAQSHYEKGWCHYLRADLVWSSLLRNSRLPPQAAFKSGLTLFT